MNNLFIVILVKCIKVKLQKLVFINKLFCNNVKCLIFYMVYILYYYNVHMLFYYNVIKLIKYIIIY